MTDFKAILIEQAGVATGPAKSVEDSLDGKRNNHFGWHLISGCYKIENL